MIIPLDVVMVHPNVVAAFCPFQKIDKKKAEKYLNETFQAHRLDANVKIISEEKQFVKRLRDLKPMKEYEDDGSVEYGAGVLKSLSM